MYRIIFIQWIKRSNNKKWNSVPPHWESPIKNIDTHSFNYLRVATFFLLFWIFFSCRFLESLWIIIRIFALITLIFLFNFRMKKSGKILLMMLRRRLLLSPYLCTSQWKKMYFNSYLYDLRLFFSLLNVVFPIIAEFSGVLLKGFNKLWMFSW